MSKERENLCYSLVFSKEETLHWSSGYNEFIIEQYKKQIAAKLIEAGADPKTITIDFSTSVFTGCVELRGIALPLPYESGIQRALRYIKGKNER